MISVTQYLTVGGGKSSLNEAKCTNHKSLLSWTLKVRASSALDPLGSTSFTSFAPQIPGVLDFLSIGITVFSRDRDNYGFQHPTHTPVVRLHLPAPECCRKWPVSQRYRSLRLVLPPIPFLLVTDAQCNSLTNSQLRLFPGHLPHPPRRRPLPSPNLP